MKMRLLAVAGLAALSSSLSTHSAFALFDHDDCDRHSECYKEVRSPDLYTTRYRSVMVSPGFWETKTVPAVYGTHNRRVLVTPGQTVVHREPAQYGVIHAQVVVSPGYQAWQRRGGLFHDRVICKVDVPPKVETVQRSVLVAPEKRVAEHIPARYEWVDEPYVIRPMYTTRVYHKPVYRTVAERVLVQKGVTTLVPVDGRHFDAAPANVVAPRRGSYK